MTSTQPYDPPTSPSPLPSSPSLNPPPRPHQHPNSPPVRFLSVTEDLATRPVSPQPGNGGFGMRRSASRDSNQAGVGAGLGVSGVSVGSSGPVERSLIAEPAFGTTATPQSSTSRSQPPSSPSHPVSPALHVSPASVSPSPDVTSDATLGRKSPTPNLLLPRSHSPRPLSSASFASSHNTGPTITRIASPMEPSTTPTDDTVAPMPVARRQSASDLLSLSPPMEPLTELDVLKDLASGGTIARSRSRNWGNEISGDSGWSGTNETGEQAAKPSTEPLLVRTSNVQPPSSALGPLPAKGSAASGYPPRPRTRHRQSADSPLAFYTSFVIAILLPALFLVFNADWLWHTNEGGTRWGKALVVVVAVASVIVWVLMLITALSNPGIIPRNLDPDPPRHWIPLAPNASSTDAKEGEGEGEWRVEMRYVEVLGGKAVVGCKWCETCKTYRPPRTSHCRLCDNCVERTDHHCAFLNTCIGRRNYLPFFLFLLSATLLASLSIALSGVHIAFGGPRWDWQRIGSLVVLVLTAVVSAPVGCLAVYHVGLACAQRTTIEMVHSPAFLHQAPLPLGFILIVARVGGHTAPPTAHPLRPPRPFNSPPILYHTLHRRHRIDDEPMDDRQCGQELRRGRLLSGKGAGAGRG
ncbi:hypothetical protein NBRC10513_007077 [Rhodotorula toruloides]